MEMAGNNEEEAASGNINPLLLESARVGSWEALDYLLRREYAQEPPLMIATDEFCALLAIAYRRIGVPAAPDVELGTDHQPASHVAGALLQGVTPDGDTTPPAVPPAFGVEEHATPEGDTELHAVPAAPDVEDGVNQQPASFEAAQELLLLGVTPDGDTALHVVASNGNDMDFVNSAAIICGRHRGLPYVKNNNGDTPFHCAVRAGNPEMVSYFIYLAGREAPPCNINPLLLFSARRGSWKALGFLFRREDRQYQQMLVPTEEFYRCIRGTEESTDSDIEEGVAHQPCSLAAGELLKGVTPDGDTALHAVAGNGDGKDFESCADMIYARDRDLLFAKNHNGDTPLHFAARAGNSKMVSRLIDLARQEGPHGEITLLRMQNRRRETALHEAVRFDNGRILGTKESEALYGEGTEEERTRRVLNLQEERSIVKLLMVADPGLAYYCGADGISPLYLAILLDKSTIALAIFYGSDGNISYSGADGQNALHVTVRRGTDRVMLEFLLDCNKSLTTQVDKDGSTPLHFVRFTSSSTWPLKELFIANPSALYQADKNGFYPIHVAASLGARDAILFFLRECPDSAGLRDTKGMTFLHVAVEKRRLAIVAYVCKNPSLSWILNMQDRDGNTALNLAIKAGEFGMFCALYGNLEVKLNLINNQGETPRDLSRSKLPRGMGFAWNPENRISHVLYFFGAPHGVRRLDKNVEKYSCRPKAEDEEKVSKRLKDTARNYIVPAVLIATMAFTATFAIPGGYRNDDHPNGGTPTLSGRYIFDAFIMATTLAFICSSLATIGYMFAGHPIVNLTTRQNYVVASAPLMGSAVTSLSIAFALAVYMVLAPIARSTAIVVCVLITPVPLYIYMGGLVQMVILARPVLTRNGRKLGRFVAVTYLLSRSADMIVNLLWPYIVTFGWAAFARIKRHRGQ